MCGQLETTIKGKFVKKYPLKLLFKGERDYHQGGDIYIAIQEIAQNLIGENTWVSHIVFRGFSRNNCEIVLGDSGNIDGTSIRAKCKINTGKELIGGTILETGTKTIGRYAFDEGAVKREAIIDGLCIRQKKRAGFFAIEEIIVLTKALHNKLIPLKAGRWIFSQLDLIRPLPTDKTSCYAIEQCQNLANRMTVSNILVKQKLIGKIRFTVTRK